MEIEGTFLVLAAIESVGAVHRMAATHDTFGFVVHTLGDRQHTFRFDGQQLADEKRQQLVDALSARER